MVAELDSALNEWIDNIPEHRTYLDVSPLGELSIEVCLPVGQCVGTHTGIT